MPTVLLSVLLVKLNWLVVFCLPTWPENPSSTLPNSWAVMREFLLLFIYLIYLLFSIIMIIICYLIWKWRQKNQDIEKGRIGYAYIYIYIYIKEDCIRILLAKRIIYIYIIDYVSIHIWWWLLLFSAQFAEVLGDVVSNQKFQDHEFTDVLQQTAAESANAAACAQATVFEAAHNVAFRNGLGNSIFASPASKVNNAVVKSYAAELFKTGNIALVGAGIPLETVQKFAETYITAPAGSSSVPAAKYFGGEQRIEAATDKSHLILAFEGAPLNSAEYAAAQVLRFALGGEQRVQWAAAAGLLGEAAAKLGEGAELKAFNAGYSDAGLFGVYASASSSGISSAAAAAAEQLKAVTGGVSEQVFASALAQAKFAAVSGFETRLDRLETVGSQVKKEKKRGL